MMVRRRAAFAERGFAPCTNFPAAPLRLVLTTKNTPKTDSARAYSPSAQNAVRQHRNDDEIRLRRLHAQRQRYLVRE
jgi:hypothetical protein